MKSETNGRHAENIMMPHELVHKYYVQSSPEASSDELGRRLFTAGGVSLY
jgi:hypothetical protein